MRSPLYIEVENINILIIDDGIIVNFVKKNQ